MVVSLGIERIEDLPHAHLSPETLLQLAPGVRTRFDAAGHVLLDAPDGTAVDLGPRGYAALSLFAQPLALGEAIELVRARGTLHRLRADDERRQHADRGRRPRATGRPAAGRQAAGPTRWSTPGCSMTTAGLVTTSAALVAAVRPGDVVLDIGTGSGVLAVAAARSGARRVYAVEASDIAEVAGRVFAANGVTDTVTLVPGWSRQIELPEPADLLVAEIIGNEPFEEEILETTLDARRRLLKPDARLIPHRLTLLARPLRLPDGEARQRAIGRAAVERWRRLYEMEFQPLLDAAVPGPVNMPTEAEVVAGLAARRPTGHARGAGSGDVRGRLRACLRRPRRRRAGHGECRRSHVPRRPLRGDRAHPRSLDVADLELGDVGVGAPRPATGGAGGCVACALQPPRTRSTRRAHLRGRRESMSG